MFISHLRFHITAIGYSLVGETTRESELAAPILEPPREQEQRRRNVIVSSVAITVLFLFLFSPTGVINKLLSYFGMTGPSWFYDPRGLFQVILTQFGVTTPLSGPSRPTGEGLKTGLEVLMEWVNRAGGIHGRKLTAVFYDDKYEPKETLKHTDWNKSQAAAILGIERSTLDRKLKGWGLTRAPG